MRNEQTSRQLENFPRTGNRSKRVRLYWTFLLFFSLAALNAQQLVYLTWNNEVGCQVSTNNGDRKKYFELIDSGECLRVCKGSTVIYEVHETDTNWTGVTWTITGGVIQGYPTPTTCEVTWDSFASSTVGSISGVVHTAEGDIAIQELCIDLTISPSARFAKAPFNFRDWGSLDLDAPIYACENEPIQFLDGSITRNGIAIIDWQWNFGDSIINPVNYTSTARHPIHQYTAEGTYTATLTVTNACGCTHTHSQSK